MLLKVRLDDVRAILKHALDTVAEHPEILKNLTQVLDDLLTGRLGDALGTVDNVLTGLGDDGTVDELLKGRLEDVRDTLQEVLSRWESKLLRKRTAASSLTWGRVSGVRARDHEHANAERSPT